MAKKKVKKSEKKSKPMFYKGYDIKWLKKEPEHPDYKLVAEYEEKYGERE
jgi:hypothetical protein